MSTARTNSSDLRSLQGKEQPPLAPMTSASAVASATLARASASASASASGSGGSTAHNSNSATPGTASPAPTPVDPRDRLALLERVLREREAECVRLQVRCGLTYCTVLYTVLYTLEAPTPADADLLFIHIHIRIHIHIHIHAEAPDARPTRPPRGC